MYASNAVGPVGWPLIGGSVLLESLLVGLPASGVKSACNSNLPRRSVPPLVYTALRRPHPSIFLCLSVVNSGDEKVSNLHRSLFKLGDERSRYPLDSARYLDSGARHHAGAAIRITAFLDRIQCRHRTVSKHHEFNCRLQFRHHCPHVVNECS